MTTKNSTKRWNVWCPLSIRPNDGLNLPRPSSDFEMRVRSTGSSLPLPCSNLTARSRWSSVPRWRSHSPCSPVINPRQQGYSSLRGSPTNPALVQLIHSPIGARSKKRGPIAAGAVISLVDVSQLDPT